MILTGILAPNCPFICAFPKGEVPLLSRIPKRLKGSEESLYLIHPDYISSVQREMIFREYVKAEPRITREIFSVYFQEGIGIDVRWFDEILIRATCKDENAVSLWEIAGFIDKYLPSVKLPKMIALLNVAHQEQTTISYQIKEWGVEGIPADCLELIDDLEGKDYLEIAFHLSLSVLDSE